MEQDVWARFVELLAEFWGKLKQFFDGLVFKEEPPVTPGDTTDIDQKISELARGITGEGIVILGQCYLRYLGFPIGKFGPNRNGIDGDSGPITLAALQAFQKMRTLTVGEQLDLAAVDQLRQAVYERLTIRELVRVAGSAGVELSIVANSAQAEFINAVYYYAILDEAETRVSAAVTTAQAILESDYGKAVPVDRATGKYSYNLFGIKGTGPAGSVQAFGWEEDPATGKWFRQLSQFMAYSSFADSIKGHSQFLLNNGRYARAFKTKTPAEFARSIAKAGYATDSKYAEKLISVMGTWGLT